MPIQTTPLFIGVSLCIVISVVIAIFILVHNPATHILTDQIVPRIIFKKSGIPNILYRTRCVLTGVKNREYKKIELSWKRENKEWNIVWINDDTINAFLLSLGDPGGAGEHDPFIRQQSKRIQKCYKKLIPGAFKADLWRVVQLYITGGAYVDASAVAHVSLNKILKTIPLGVNLISVRDLKMGGHDFGIHNGFIMVSPKHLIFKGYILKMLDNIEQSYYGTSPLSITGPICFAESLLETSALVRSPQQIPL